MRNPAGAIRWGSSSLPGMTNKQSWRRGGVAVGLWLAGERGVILRLTMTASTVSFSADHPSLTPGSPMIRQPASCPRCGSPADPSALRCARCGTERLPPQPKRYWERSHSAASVVAWTLLALLCLGSMTVRLMVVPCVLALVWHERTRRFIPAATLMLTMLVLGGASGAQWYARRQAAGGAAAGFREGSREAPSGPDRVAQVSSRYEADLRRFANGVAVVSGVEYPRPPAGWHTARYAAAAGQYPGVERYWKRQIEYAAEMRRVLPAWSDSALRALGREAGMSGEQADAMLKAAEGGVTAPARWALELAVDSAALAYHRYLVSIDGRVSYDQATDRVIFDRQNEMERATQLEQRMQAALRKLQTFIEDRHGKVLWIPDPPRAAAG